MHLLNSSFSTCSVPGGAKAYLPRATLGYLTRRDGNRQWLLGTNLPLPSPPLTPVELLPGKEPSFNQRGASTRGWLYVSAFWPPKGISYVCLARSSDECSSCQAHSQSLELWNSLCLWLTCKWTKHFCYSILLKIIIARILYHISILCV